VRDHHDVAALGGAKPEAIVPSPGDRARQSLVQDEDRTVAIFGRKRAAVSSSATAARNRSRLDSASPARGILAPLLSDRGDRGVAASGRRC
jgi:hypothetical protein